jgi:methylated-DNA-[protein]-cysteine S-methyltransferase
MPHLSIASPLGPLTVFEQDAAIVALEWGRAPPDSPTPLLEEAARQLDAYFRGERRGFDLPLAPAGTPFRRRAWDALARIPFGRVRTYGELAAELGTAARAVGMACAGNPLPVLIPCHRVVGAARRGFAAGGYSGGQGVAGKLWLLAHEGVDLAPER